MVDLSRRKTILGLGMLAVGSGSAFTSAAFASSTTPTADLRVVVDQALTAEVGPGFDPSDSKFVNESNFFNSTDIDDSSGAAFDGNDLPLAFVNQDTNDNLVINAAVGLDNISSGNPLSENFPELIQITNSTTDSVDVGIAYDRDESQYGDDIPGNNLSYTLAQSVYKFQANSLKNGTLGSSNYTRAGTGSGAQISPDSTGGSRVQDTGNPNTIDNNPDLPAAAVTIPAGDALTIDLVVDIDNTDKNSIENEAGQLSTFGSSRKTVDIMDAITVGTFDSPTVL